MREREQVMGAGSDGERRAHMAQMPFWYAQDWQYIACWCRFCLQTLHLLAYGCQLRS